jgi:gliding motility-associated lipoprotein GldB
MLRIIFKNKKPLVPIVLLMLVMACKQDARRIDIAGVDVAVPVTRFEKELFSIKEPGVSNQISNLEKKHSLFFTLFTKYIIRSADKNDSLSKANLMNFVMDKEIQTVYKETETLYSDFSDIQTQLTEGFRRYKKSFPGKVVPSVYTFISGFNYAVISADSLLGIGLDMYLGASCKYYPALGLPKYKMNNMRKEYVVSDAMKGWMQTEYPIDETKKDFLSHMVYYGKLLYFQDMILPDTPDTIKIGYTEKQLNWCVKNEAAIWAHFINQKLLFAPGYADYHKFINEGPTTNGFPKESPSLLGNWIGWQLVRSYMQENPNVSMAALFNETDAQKILTLSKYKPKK